MNLLLLHPDQHLYDALWRLNARQCDHVRTVLKLAEGQQCRAGLLGESTGFATIKSIKNNEVLVEFKPESQPMPPLPLSLLMALPRPKMLKRILIDATSLGIKRIVLINSWKVDKSYWQTPNLKADLLREKMILGLEQARDTRLPELILAPRFKPFVEDSLGKWAGSGQRILAHPGDDYPTLPCDLSEPVTLAVGPEGGWTDYEVDMLQRQGFACHRFGARILRVETALPALVGRLMRLP
ncbi:16S rRNA (uracil(1498)-N(3))-methyltransferase [Alcanivorax sp. HI0083]|jgi:RNA methyltransferase, RsmE family|uniref:16S rRNA (uracil(1498)-N(3))-methyltransferase n=1 Tax=unclassified Alcanivorax TaxID=2638842 RepID=UPI0007B9AD3B|nr:MULTISPECIES: 16S rRNA (uracil(1498)-N(3))-methyltransferase [unclassified Alcanivorax]KZY39495.1 16S rRNA (uracil(1498)-N(3))-methyltransferase [Alcanivorax sp. HI0044]KZZ24981.1 16S rRNA (uracil(1498)-N(3))-methyltransferase [Alcanivorax sp. HI0083]